MSKIKKSNKTSHKSSQRPTRTDNSFEKSKKSNTSPQAAIHIRGARHNNLKSINLSIPHNALTVITGPSGSGKSSLVLDTIFAEGQRRYVETFSPYTRQFLTRMDKPQVDSIEGILPAVALEQVNNIRTSRSTVGTITEIHDYLKILFAHSAVLYDPLTGQPITAATPQTIAQELVNTLLEKDTLISFNVPFPEGTTWKQALQFLSQQGYRRFILDDTPTRIDDFPNTQLDSYCPSQIQIIHDRVRISPTNMPRIIEALETSLRLGKGSVTVFWRDPNGNVNYKSYHTQLKGSDGTTYIHPTPALFSFNHPLGACPVCKGFGRIIGIDYDLVIPNHNLSLQDGAIKPWQTQSGKECQRDLLKACKRLNIPTDVPWKNLSPQHQQIILHGESPGIDPDTAWHRGLWYGVDGFFQWLESKTYKMHVRVYLSRYRSYKTCPTCAGTRYQSQTLHWYLTNSRGSRCNIAQLNTLPIRDALDFLSNLLPPEHPTAHRAYTETLTRLHYLNDVGLGYLSLDRQTRTLSGGELQRVNLTTSLGTTLVNTLFILDEPSIGLHPRDTHRVISILHRLRDAGNTVLVVEHDPAIILAADHVIDLGPGRGAAGGAVCACGSPAELLKKPISLTAQYLAGEKNVPTIRTPRTPKPGFFITLKGIRQHNLRNIDVNIPLGLLCVITGPSGSGKSTLVYDVLYKNILRERGQPVDNPGQVEDLQGVKLFREVQLVDQSPLARTPRSNPVLYIGIWDAIRELFASTEEARSAGLNASHFSFNSGDGRCDRCQGMGYEKIEMQFLSDLYLPCPVCKGKRFKPHVLQIRYHGLSVDDILNSDVTTASAFFRQRSSESTTTREQKLTTHITTALQLLEKVGLGYLTLGQPLRQLSGGEAQRLKLIKHLVPTTTTTASPKHKKNTPTGDLLILDEPTTGLHLDDVTTLIHTLHQLVDAGHSLIVIEHHLDVIKNADYIIDLGPEGGDCGGQICAQGTPEQIAENPASPTGPFLKKTLQRDAELQNKNNKHMRRLTLTPTSRPAPPPPTTIQIRGARHHNLKNIDVDIPLNAWTVLTGLSGSGKSTLAFDIIFAEGQRRYLDCLNTYARQFITQMEKPAVDSATGIPPTVAIEQNTTRGSIKSTVGTVTEVYHFMRLLWAKCGTQHDPDTGEPAVRQSETDITHTLTRLARKKTLQILAPLVKARKGYHTEVARWALRHQIPLLRVDGKWVEPSAFKPLERFKEHTIEAYLGEITPSTKPTQAATLISSALRYGHGTLISIDSSGTATIYSTHLHCPRSGRSFEELDPRLFSFNSPHGWCPHCQGHGILIADFDMTACTQLDQELELEQRIENFLLDQKEEDPAAEEGSPIRKKTPSITSPYPNSRTCPHCQGTRLNAVARAVRVAGKSITEISSLSVSAAQKWFRNLHFQGREATLSRDIIPEILQRLDFLTLAGVDYLQLDRSVRTLSGGENQRVRLAAQLGSNLEGVLYVLDEPTIGLHPQDNRKLLQLLTRLRNKRNTLLVVEHDEDTMRAADNIIDLGPGAGIHGGQVVATGHWKQLAKKKQSPTALLLGKPLVHPMRGTRRDCTNATFLTLTGVSANNIHNITLSLPRRRLVVVCGPSGAGKSTLVREILSPLILAHIRQNRTRTPAARKHPSNTHTQISGIEGITNVVEVDQTPIGKTSRSTPATYTGIFDTIRTLFAALPESKVRGYGPARFSYNSAEGRCPTCKGLGEIRLEMSFLPPASIPCSDCNSTRYNPATLEIQYKGKNIAEILAMPVEEARDFFSAHAALHRTLSLLCDTGLGYLTLGQSSSTLSGGEAQRLKLVTELARNYPGEVLYLLEEPSIGLHGHDVARLLELLHRLVDAGHTVIVIEHNLDILAEADWLIELGPGGGDRGGQLLHCGPPQEIFRVKNSPTAPFLKKVLTSSVRS